MSGSHRIRWWVYVVAIAFGILIGLGIFMLEERRDYGLMGAPWFVSAIMLALGVIELYLAYQVHRYTNTDPKKRAQLKPLDPERAVNTLILAKALALGGAMLLGCYATQIIACASRADAPYYKQIIIECVIATVVSLFDWIAGIISEWLCQLPPMEGPEHPKIKIEKRRQQMA